MIDRLNERVGIGTFWLVLMMSIVSYANVVVRFLFVGSSNGLLEIQWQLFAAVFLLCAPTRCKKRARADRRPLWDLPGPAGRGPQPTC